MSGANAKISGSSAQARLGDKCAQVRTGPHAGVRFSGVPLQPSHSQGLSYQRPSSQIEYVSTSPALSRSSIGANVHVSYRPVGLHRKVSAPGEDSDAPLSVASEKALEDPGVLEQVDSSRYRDQTPHAVVARTQQSHEAGSLTPGDPSGDNLHRRIPQRLGSPLGQQGGKRKVVPMGSVSSHKRSRVEGCVYGLVTFPLGLQTENRVGGVRQHDGSCIYQQTRGHEIHGIVRTDVADHGVVHKVSGSSEGSTHYGGLKCDSGQFIQDAPGATDRVVPLSSGVQATVSAMAHPVIRPFCDELEPQTARICVSPAGSTGLGCGRAIHLLAGDRCLRLPAHGNTTEGATKSETRSVSVDPNRPGVAKNVVVLGSGGIVPGETTLPPDSSKVIETTSDPVVPPESGIPQSPRVAPRSTHLQEQGFAPEVADRISAPQRPSTRAVYKSKWAVFERWCAEHALEVRSVSIKDITDFFMYLFSELKRRRVQLKVIGRL